MPFTIGNYIGSERARATDDGTTAFPKIATDDAVCTDAIARVEERIAKLMSAPSPTHTADYFHRKLGNIIWKYCGMSRTEEGLKAALQEIPALRKQFWEEVKITGSDAELNQALERAGRVADFFELGELMCIDALRREESAGGHFREEHQAEGEAERNDEEFQYVAAWAFGGDPSKPELHKEPLEFTYVEPSTRSYK